MPGMHLGKASILKCVDRDKTPIQNFLLHTHRPLGLVNHSCSFFSLNMALLSLQSQQVQFSKRVQSSLQQTVSRWEKCVLAVWADIIGGRNLEFYTPHKTNKQTCVLSNRPCLRDLKNVPVVSWRELSSNLKSPTHPVKTLPLTRPLRLLYFRRLNISNI